MSSNSLQSNQERNKKGDNCSVVGKGCDGDKLLKDPGEILKCKEDLA